VSQAKVSACVSQFLVRVLGLTESFGQSATQKVAELALPLENGDKGRLSELGL